MMDDRPPVKQKRTHFYYEASESVDYSKLIFIIEN